MENTKLGKCAECPVISLFLEEATQIQTANQVAAESVMSNGFDMAMNLVYDTLQAHIGISGIEGETVDSADQFTLQMRKSIASKMNEVDESAEEIHQTVEKILSHCEGPLKMRAKKAGKIITATVCCSTEIELGISREPVGIDRRTE